MFDKEYSFKGQHAEKVIKLTAKFDEKNQLFKRNLDVYLMAPIVGFLYNSKAPLDTGETTKIFPQQLTEASEDLLFNYRLIMLLNRKKELTIEERIDKAFRYYGSNMAKSDEDIFEEYVRGGVDILYDKIMASATKPEDYKKNLYDFMEEIDERYNQELDTDSIKELCSLARR